MDRFCLKAHNELLHLIGVSQKVGHISSGVMGQKDINGWLRHQQELTADEGQRLVGFQ